jgi:hypothetical protein
MRTERNYVGFFENGKKKNSQSNNDAICLPSYLLIILCRERSEKMQQPLLSLYPVGISV